MANGNVDIAFKKDWPLANPWLWLGAGLGFTAWSWLWTLTFGETASDGRVIVLAVGLLISGFGVCLRWNDRQRVYLSAWAPPLEFAIRLFLGCLFALLSLGCTGLFIYTFFSREVGLNPAAAFVVWIAAAPLSFYAARRCFKVTPEERGQRMAAEEVGLALVIAAGICLLGSFTLYLGSRLADDWDTIRLVLRVFTAVSLYGAALVVVSPGLRRFMLSMLFVLHFTAITTAVLSAPPAPWIVLQTWIRVFRPYLEFMYLNNAYHFYAPDPGPASYLWCRLIYEDPQGVDYGLWYKVPQVDEKGRTNHTVALEYQRFMALTETAAATDSPPPPIITDAAGNWDTPPIYKNRLALMPTQVAMIGARPGPHFRIPLHPQVPQMQQVMIPNDSSHRLFQSFARFLGRKFAVHPDPEHADWTYKSVKIYRVTHHIPPIGWLKLGIPPNDPVLYRPFYMGNYDADGFLVDKDDPYLFWLLPILRDNPNDPESSIKDYARLHAGDPQWFRASRTEGWVARPAPSRANAQ